jgi:hypothetical protein
MPNASRNDDRESVAPGAAHPKNADYDQDAVIAERNQQEPKP